MRHHRASVIIAALAASCASCDSDSSSATNLNSLSAQLRSHPEAIAQTAAALDVQPKSVQKFVDSRVHAHFYAVGPELKLLIRRMVFDDIELMVQPKRVADYCLGFAQRRGIRVSRQAVLRFVANMRRGMKDDGCNNGGNQIDFDVCDADEEEGQWEELRRMVDGV